MRFRFCLKRISPNQIFVRMKNCEKIEKEVAKIFDPISLDHQAFLSLFFVLHLKCFGSPFRIFHQISFHSFVHCFFFRLFYAVLLAEILKFAHITNLFTVIIVLLFFFSGISRLIVILFFLLEFFSSNKRIRIIIFIFILINLIN